MPASDQSDQDLFLSYAHSDDGGGLTAARTELERLTEHIAQRQAGWRYGPRKDNDAKTHPCLVPYAQLPPDEQDKDRSAVRQIPATLAKAGFRVHRLRTQS